MDEYSIVWGFPHIDSTAVDYGTGAVELNDLIFRCTSFPPGDVSAGRAGVYIWLDLWTVLSVRNRSVTGTLPFGSPHRLRRCCLRLAALSLHWIWSAVFRCVVILYRQLSETHLMKRKYIGIFRCIVTLYGQMAEACHLNWTCIGWACTCMLCCVVILFLLIQQFPELRQAKVKCIPFRHDSDITLLLLRISQGTGPSIRQIA